MKLTAVELTQACVSKARLQVWWLEEIKYINELCHFQVPQFITKKYEYK